MNCGEQVRKWPFISWELDGRNKQVIPSMCCRQRSTSGSFPQLELNVCVSVPKYYVAGLLPCPDQLQTLFLKAAQTRGTSVWPVCQGFRDSLVLVDTCQSPVWVRCAEELLNADISAREAPELRAQLLLIRCGFFLLTESRPTIMNISPCCVSCAFWL